MMKCLVMLMLAMASSLQADAQLKNLLKNAACEALGNMSHEVSSPNASAVPFSCDMFPRASHENGTAEALGELTSKLLGTDTLDAKHLVGKWTYSEPCIAFESESLLANVGNTLVGEKVEATLAKQLKHLGFNEGKLALKLNADSTGTATLNEKKVEVHWSVSESNLILTFPLTNRSIHMNAKLSGKSLQLAMSTDKLLALATAITEKAGIVNSTLGIVSALMKNKKGMHVGLEFKR